MPQESFGQVVKRRTLGMILLLLVVSLIALSIAIYNKAFTPTVDVTLKANSIGNQLQKQSDVKERGVIVGSVKSVRSNGTQALVTLALDPSRVKDIPKTVQAQILPKTLFGEQYVSLLLPKGQSNAGNNPIASGDIIHQDVSKPSLEAQDVFNNLYPVLTDVEPAELNSTLTALATALNGRGKELGQTLVNLHRYLLKLNPHDDQLVDDIGKLGQVASEYNSVSPDLFSTLKNLETNVRTVVQRRAALDSLLTTGSSTADVLSSFLSDNRSHLIEVAGQSSKLYGLLAEYSPEFSCLASGVNELANGVDQAIYNHAIHLSITVDSSDSSTPANEKPNQSRGPYVNGEQPSLVTGYGPNCFGLPDNPQPDVNGNFQIPAKYRCLNDGAPLTADACGSKRGNSKSAKRVSSSSATSSSLTGGAAGDTGETGADSSMGSGVENALVDSLVAGSLGTTPNKVPGGTTLLVAPLLRGHKVVVK